VKRIARGLRALHQLLGLPFAIACVGLAALLLRALVTGNVVLLVVGLLMLALLLIRSHDLGDRVSADSPCAAVPKPRLDYPSADAKSAMALGCHREGHEL